MSESNAIQETAKFLKKEHGFKLPLPTIVKGTNAFGDSFIEKTELSYISSKGGSFWLKNPILFGSNLELNVDLPANIGTEGLKLLLRGKVVFIEAIDSHNFRQRVSIRFDKDFKIQPPKNRFHE